MSISYTPRTLFVETNPTRVNSAAEQLVIQTDRDGDELTLSLRGELDLASAPALERALQGPADGTQPRLIVDLSGLQFMDSSGLHVLLRANRASRATGVGLELRGATRQIAQLLELTGTAELFSIENRTPSATSA
ncbi:MAG: STAS domain-containing protein [Solirubrobacteraceae bacterium]